MPMEQETMGMLIGGFSVIIGVTFVIVLVLYSMVLTVKSDMR